MADVEMTGGDIKVKTEKKDMEVDKDGEGIQGVVKGIKKEDGDAKVKTEKKEEEKLKGEGIKNEGVKSEGGVKKEGQRSEEDVKREMKLEGGAAKGEYSLATKGEGAKGEMKGEGAKGEMKGEGVKGESKRERSRSKKKKKKDKVKKEKGDDDKKDKKDKKRKKSMSPGGTKKRKSRWGPDTGGFSMQAMQRGGSGGGGGDDMLPKFSDEEMVARTICLENLSLSCTGQELIEFFNGAILAVTANAVQQAANRNMAPVFACTVTEEDRGSGDRRKSAELKFRTPDGASVCMKLNGIEYKGTKVACKRPENFVRDEDGQDPSTKISLQEMSMAKLIGGTGTGAGGGSQGPSPKLSIFNLPEVMTEQICRDLLSQFGKLRMLSLIRDLGTGKIKGYGIFEYDNANDVDLAIVALNGFVCGSNVIRVQKLGAAAATATDKKAQPVAATAMSNSMTQKIVSNPVLAMQVKQGREIGSRPTTIVQLLNAVYQEDLMDDADFEDITAEVHAEASKHGTVTRVVIPKPAKDGSYVDGVGKIFICFGDLTAARKFQMDANGRKFENRVVCAAFYPADKFHEGKFKLWSA